MAAADGVVMFNSLRSTSPSLVDSLRALDGGITVFELDEAWLVVSQVGIFVLTEDDGDLTSASERAANQAVTVRQALADKMAWVPFVDAMCVTTAATFDPHQPCLVVPQDLIAHTIGEGPEGIDEDSLRILEALPYPILR